MLKNGFVFLCLLSIFSLSSKAAAQSVAITAFSLDVKREQVFFAGDARGERSSSDSFSMEYGASPFFFGLKLKASDPQIIVCGENQCLCADGGVVFDFSEGADFLKQTARDILSWFLPDAGLSQTGYKIERMEARGGAILAVWKYAGAEEQLVSEVHSESDYLGRFTSASMYDAAMTRIAKTEFFDYADINGTLFPSKIKTTIIQNGTDESATVMEFSNIVINDKKDFTMSALLGEITFEKNAFKNAERVNAGSPSERLFEEKTDGGAGLLRTAAELSFGFYKKFITDQDTSACGFYPTCSEYMKQAVRANGFIGVIQGFDRLKRCTSAERKRGLYPIVDGGKQYDPVRPLGREK